jgi:hypothetical protein
MSTPFTDRELTRAWRQLRQTSLPLANQGRNNAHRLLLFYAVECGLKAVWLKRNNKTLFAGDDIEQTGHNLCRLLDQLRAGQRFRFSQNIRLTAAKDVSGTDIPRNGSIEILHQAWRYGGESYQPNDTTCEQQLEQVLEWINGELQ